MAGWGQEFGCPKGFTGSTRLSVAPGTVMRAWMAVFAASHEAMELAHVNHAIHPGMPML